MHKVTNYLAEKATKQTLQAPRLVHFLNLNREGRQPGRPTLPDGRKQAGNH